MGGFMWRDERMSKLLGIEHPILQAPMAGANGSRMAIAVSQAGGLGALPCAMLSAEQARAELTLIRAETSKPINVNFFCHRTPEADPKRDDGWRGALARFYVELGLDPAAPPPRSVRLPFDDAMCDVVTEFARDGSHERLHGASCARNRQSHRS